jgi:16S rRNA (guanine(966)-N(2))-methyltransferase RsmD
MRTQVRIVAGALRGRRLDYKVDRDLRPMPDMVRQALFNILGDAVPERTFFDLFAGTGAVGIEALSRGAASAAFVERDARVAAAIIRHLQEFGIADRARVERVDVYRWVERWHFPPEPVIVFLGPPYPDLANRAADLMHVVRVLQEKAAAASLLVLQSDRSFDPQLLPEAATWEHRIYGRNRLSTWTKRVGV